MDIPESPMKDHEDDEGIEAHDIQGEAERAGSMQAWEEKTWGGDFISV